MVLAVDGPYGPRHRMKTGCVELARETGSPIVHVEYSCERAKENKERWDRRLVPVLFDTINIKYHAPIYVGGDEGGGDDEIVCRRLEKQLLKEGEGTHLGVTKKERE